MTKKTFILFVIALLTVNTFPRTFSHPLKYYNNWVPLGPDVGGIFVWQLIIHPFDHNILFIRTHTLTDSSSTQIYKSDNGGSSWKLFSSHLSFITDMALDPKNPSIFYLVGENHLYKSFDGGITWHNKYLIDTVEVYISDIFISAQNSATIYLGGDCEIPLQVLAVYKSNDGGETWQRNQVSPADNTYYATCFDVSPKDENVQFIGGTKDAGATLPGIMYRTIDGGQSWEDISGGLDRRVTAMAVDPLYPQNLYVSADYTGIYRSKNGGSTWLINEELNDYIYDLQIDPQNTNIIYAGGYRGNFFKSTDGGITWPHYGRGLVGNCMDIEVDPTDSNIVYSATTDGVYKSLDVGANWFFSGSGLYAAHINSIAISAANPGAIYIAVQEHGLYKTVDAGNGWESLTNSPSEFMNALIVHPHSTDTAYALAGSGGGKARLYKTEDGGLAWQSVDDYLENGHALTIDPDNPSIIFSAGSYKKGSTDIMAVCKSADGGRNWSRYLLNSSRSEAYALAIHPKDSNIIFVGGIEFETNIKEIGKIYKSLDGGNQWQDMSSPLFNNDFIFSLALDPLSIEIVYAGGYSGIYKSINGGSIWAFVPASELRDIIDIVINPNNPSTIYAASKSNGIFVSLDEGQSWSSINNGLLATEMECLVLDSNNHLLYAGSIGRGIFRLDISTLDVKPKIKTEVRGNFILWHNYPNPFNAETIIQFDLPQNTKLTLTVYSLLGQKVCTLLDEKIMAGSHFVSWSGQDSFGNDVVSGIYLYSLQTANFSEVRKMILLR